MPKSLLRSFIPWVIFFALFIYDQMHLQIGAIGALVALVLLSWRGLREGFIFDWGSLLFFVFICCSVLILYLPWVRTDADLLASLALSIIAWISLFLQRPFTLEYAKQSVAREYWQTSLFMRTNRYLTILWAGAFTVITLLSIISEFSFGKNYWLEDALPLVCLIATVIVSLWFPKWYSRREIGVGGVITLEGLSDLKYLETDTAKLSYRTIGTNGPRLVLLPGINMSMYGWDPLLVERLAEHYQVVLLDYPGIGESRVQAKELSIISLTQILHEFLAALTAEPVILLGYAMGGYFAQLITINYSEQVQGLVLIATDAGGRRASHPDPALLDRILDTKGSLEEQCQRLMDVLFPAPAIPAMQAKMRDIFRTAGLVRSVPGRAVLAEKVLLDEWYAAGGGSYSYLSDINQPTLVMMGILDRVVHRQNGIVLANGMRNAKLLEFPDAGHGLIYQHPERIVGEIVQYFMH